MKLSLRMRIFRPQALCPISTEALARCKQARRARKLFQQFLVAVGLFAFVLHRAAAQSADDFFHSGARSYLSNNVAGAQKEVDQGLKLYPDDIKLKKLDELLKQQQQQQQQQNQQQNQQQQQNQSQQNQSKQNQQQQQQQQKQNEEQKQQEQSKEEQEQQKQAEQQKEKEQEQQAQAREMTPEQAKQLMDQEKADEMLLPATRKEKPHNPEHPLKDW